ncbi:DNA independent RNA polymerase I transcription factor [Vermiconidia calcicola]|uniref:DNA independent RNA polymerase I transcription factor n=1 Tax=Vermiconidia calcicola TaxID=1690605 RepID=A0ACC3NLF9_9PEZI|nr:DNA independent RNA polymerase I transcription factor [Vermiconidia calcicola]
MVSLTSQGGAMPPPNKPLTRPILGMKRDSSYIDTDDEAGLSSSTKKLRVTFDPNVNVRIMEDGNDKSFDLVKEEVRQGIERHLAPADQRDDTQYLKLLQLLNQDAFSSEVPSPRLLKKYILAIDGRVNRLGQCGKLVAAVLDLPWLGREDAFVAQYTKFLCDLASAHGKYILGVMEKLVAHFAKLPASLGRLPEETPVPRTRMFARLHLAIKTILRIVPSASDSLMRALKLTFPNDLEPTKSYLQYQKHLLRLADEVPELKAEILALVVQKLVSMDVQVQQDIEELEDEDEDKLLQRPCSKDGNAEDSDDSDIESVSESEETITEEEQRLRELRLKVAKMDATLDMLFDYYTPLLEDGSSPVSNEAYQQLLSHFSTFILPNRCRHTQFLQFHFSQASPDHTNLFAERCLQLAVQNTGSSSHRLNACAYIASFVARGSHISSDSVQHVFLILCHFLEDMRQRYEPTCRGPDRRSFSLYYAVAQAILYIFCFRWRDLVTGSSTPELDSEDFSEEDALAEGRDLAWYPEVKEIMMRNIYCKLNPLKVCSQAIVGEFAKIAHHLRFMYIFPLLETNKRLRLGQTFSYYGNGGIDIGRRETAWDRKAGDAHHQLEAYFPFDPYHLPKSKRWLENDYNEWKLPRGLQNNDEDDESESEDEYDSEEEVLPEAVGQYAASSTVAASC